MESYKMEQIVGAVCIVAPVATVALTWHPGLALDYAAWAIGAIFFIAGAYMLATAKAENTTASG